MAKTPYISVNLINMRPVDFFVYYCMQRFKTGNLNYNTPLGRACGGVGFTVGSLIVIIIELTLRLSVGYKIIEHQYPFIITFTAVYLLTGAIAYYIYHNKKRYEYIRSSGYRQFKLTNTIGFTISMVAFLLSFILMAASTIYINDYI
jgi:hypothetical protein